MYAHNNFETYIISYVLIVFYIVLDMIVNKSGILKVIVLLTPEDKNSGYMYILIAMEKLLIHFKGVRFNCLYLLFTYISKNTFKMCRISI